MPASLPSAPIAISPAQASGSTSTHRLSIKTDLSAYTVEVHSSDLTGADVWTPTYSIARTSSGSTSLPTGQILSEILDALGSAPNRIFNATVDSVVGIYRVFYRPGAYAADGTPPLPTEATYTIEKRGSDEHGAVHWTTAWALPRGTSQMSVPVAVLAALLDELTGTG